MDSSQLMGTPAGRSTLLKGLFETLPETGSAFPQEKREKWLQLAGLAMEMLYTDVAPATTAVEAPKALPAPVDSVEAVEVEARPTKFATKLQARKTSAGRPRQERSGNAPQKVPKVKARDVVLAVLANGADSMNIKEMVAAAEKQKDLDVSGFRDLKSAIYFQLPKLEQAGDIVLSDVSGPSNRYSLPEKK